MSFLNVFKDLDYSNHSCFPEVKKQSENEIDAMTAAHIEEMKIVNALADKEDRLQAFRLKAKQRVKMYSLLKNEHILDKEQKERPTNKTIVKENLKASNPRFGHQKVNHQNNPNRGDDIRIEVNENFLQQIANNPSTNTLSIDLSQLSSQRSSSLSQNTTIFNRSSVNSHEDSARSWSSTSSREIARALDIRQPAEVLFTPLPIPSLSSASNRRPQEVQERAVYRKAYGELERERVRNQRLQKEAKQKAKRLKAKAESYRKLEEQEINRTLWEGDEMEEQDEGSISSQQHFPINLPKTDNSDRLFRALLSELKDRCTQQQLVPPSLCLCWEDVWSADPDHCANNCEFYKNQKGYLSTLQNLIDCISKK